MMRDTILVLVGGGPLEKRINELVSNILFLEKEFTAWDTKKTLGLISLL